jgi:hypothetical protein
VCNKIVNLGNQTGNKEEIKTENVKVHVDEKLISPNFAQKVIDRNNLFETLRSNALVREDIEQFFAKEASKAGMPTWWKTGKKKFSFSFFCLFIFFSVLQVKMI